MNWKVLERKFPKSAIEIREYYENTGIEDGRALINSFLRTKGYAINHGFINELRDYESKIKL